jgi:hypothetical protein
MEEQGDIQHVADGHDVLGGMLKQWCFITVSNCQQQQQRHASGQGVPSALALGQIAAIHKQPVAN